MNEYRYADIEVGHTESFSVNVSQDMLDKFKDITGDVNPLHSGLFRRDHRKSYL